MMGLSSTGFSLCSFDFRLPQIKPTQAEACATKNPPFRIFNAGNKIWHAGIVKFF
jgi:hypothetical protein